jgi:very-short-patch-repair endonuclease
MPVPVPDPPFLVAEALRLGATRKQLRSPRFHAPVRGVRMDAARKEDVRSVAAAVGLALPPAAAFSHTTATALWDLPLPPGVTGLAPLHVSGPPGTRSLDANGIVTHVGLPVHDVVVRRGLAVTGPDRTVADLAALVATGGHGLTETDLVVVLDAVLGARGGARPYPRDRLEARVRELRGRRGVVPLASALRRSRRFVDSPMETLLRLRLVGSGFPCPVVGADVVDDDGRWLARPDLCWPDLRIAVEYDGRHHLTSARQRLNDVARQEELERLGWRVIVLFAYDVLGRWPATEGRVLQAFLDRGMRPEELPDAPDATTRPRVTTPAHRLA